MYFFASQLDVSRRRDAEEALGQAQKMEALGQLTGGIAHDFNNLLQVIVGYVDILERRPRRSRTPTAPRLRRATENIRIAAERATTLTQQLLAFARKQRLEGRAVNLNTLVAGHGGARRPHAGRRRSAIELRARARTSGTAGSTRPRPRWRSSTS